MELSFIKNSELKKKFGNLLSYLFFDLHLREENISEALIGSPLLDLLENNKLDEFMSLSLEKMSVVLFPEIQLVSRDCNRIDKYFWSGIQYINIFLNYRIPLRTIILLCPLEEMVKKYDVFHEMNEIELCKSFLNNEYKNKSILKEFRNKHHVSARQLSTLCNLSEASIRHFEINNDYFYNITSNNLCSISSALDIDSTFLKKKSTFIPVNYDLLCKEDFIVLLSKVIGKYFLKSNNPNLSIKFIKDKKLDVGKAYLLINGSSFLYMDGKEKYIDDAIFRKMLDFATDRYIEQNLKTNLVF